MSLAIGIDGRYLDHRYPGIGRYLFQLLRHLPAAAGDDFAIHALIERDPPAPRFPTAALAAAGVALHERVLPHRRPREPLAVRRTIRRLGVDLWHAPYYATLYAPPCPAVVTVFDLIGLDRRHLPSPRARLAFRLAVAWALRRARRVLTLSAAARDDLGRRFGVDPARVDVTPAGVDDVFRPPEPAAVEALRARHGLPERYVLHLGVDKPHKNLPRLVEAWARLRRAGNVVADDDVTLVLAGYRGPGRSAAERRARELDLDDVRILGAVDERDLPTLYGGATLFAFPSLAEGYGLPVVEAMACGTAVACARIDALAEVAGDAAVYFDPHDPDAIARVLAALLADPERRRALAEAGRARATRFSWRHTAELTVAAYRETLGGES